MGTYEVETDFYWLYAPDAHRISSWKFPQDLLHGPGYPIALALVGIVTGDPFRSGKWISIASAVLIGAFCFLLFERLFDYWSALCAQSIVLVSGQFPKYAINATTDVFFLALCLGTLAVMVAKGIAPRRRAKMMGILTALAYMSRYNGIFLVPVCLLAITLQDLPERRAMERLKLAGYYFAFLLAPLLPWLYMNYLHHGSPLYNKAYLVVAGDLYGYTSDQDGLRILAEKFHSLSEVLRYDPQRLVGSYFDQLRKNLILSITSGELVSPWVGWTAVWAFILVLFDRRPKPLVFVLVAGAVYSLLMGFIHWEARLHFFEMVVYAGLATYGAFRPLEILRQRGFLRHPACALGPMAVILVMGLTSYEYSKRAVESFLASQPTEVLAACDYLKNGNAIGAKIIARKPHLPYLCRQEWVFFPLVKSLEELHRWLQTNRVDYIAFGPMELLYRPSLDALLSPRTAPPWLKPVWASVERPYVLYKPELGAPF